MLQDTDIHNWRIILDKLKALYQKYQQNGYYITRSISSKKFHFIKQLTLINAELVHAILTTDIVRNCKMYY